ncbi:MAG TPA: hypothetical protein VH479_25665 [Acidimicrobiales bacterium]
MGVPVYDRKVRPSGWWYAAAAAIAVGGILVGLAVAAKGVDDALEAIGSFDRTPVPGVVDVEIAEPGGYSIYQEFPGAADRSGTTDPPEVVVTDPGGSLVELKAYGSFVSYDQGSLEGRGIYTFRADQAGTFHVVAAGASGSTIAVGQGMGDLSTDAVAGVFGGVIGGAILAMAGIATGIVVSITIGITRGRSRRRRRIYVSTPLPPLADAPTPAMATWPAAPAAPAFLASLTAPVASVAPGAPGWPAVAPVASGAPGWPVVASSPHPSGSLQPTWPSRSPAFPTPGPVPRPVPAVATVPASRAPAPAGVAAPSGAAASAPASPPPGIGPRVMASTGAAVRAGPATGEATRAGPAPTLVQAARPSAPPPAPTEPLSRPGDPQSLRSPVDWSRSDLELPWETESES